MGMFDAINISSSGLTAQRLRMDVIANNIANATTTRTEEGGPYVRRRVIMAPQNVRTFWKSPMLPQGIRQGIGQGVRVLSVEKDNTPNRLVYDPYHPDRIKSGPKRNYVEMPNVNVVTEMTDLISASRAYEANIALVNGSKQMWNKALEIGRTT
jgi:flagellar basal-body rod protein FlgC